MKARISRWACSPALRPFCWWRIFNVPWTTSPIDWDLSATRSATRNFATATRDAAVILIALSDQPERLVPNWQIVDRMWNAYIRVDDADAIYAEVQERGAGIDYTIYDAPHGFREFGVQDPDGHDIAFGQRLEP
jgi:hypothetical protein